MTLSSRCTTLSGRGLATLLSLAVLAAGTATLEAQTVPERTADLAAKSFRHAGLLAEDVFLAPRDLSAKAAGDTRARLEALGAATASARLTGLDSSSTNTSATVASRSRARPRA